MITIPNSSNIQLKIINYNSDEDELDIKIVPIIGWSVQDSYSNLVDGEWKVIPTEATPIIPLSISKDDKCYYCWDDKNYDLSWNLVKYDSIISHLKTACS